MLKCSKDAIFVYFWFNFWIFEKSGFSNEMRIVNIDTSLVGCEIAVPLFLIAISLQLQIVSASLAETIFPVSRFSEFSWCFQRSFRSSAEGLVHAETFRLPAPPIEVLPHLCLDCVDFIDSYRSQLSPETVDFWCLLQRARHKIRNPRNVIIRRDIAITTR